MKMKSAPRSALVSRPLVIAFALCSLVILLAMLGFFSTRSAFAQQQTQNAGPGHVTVVTSYHNDVSPALRDLPQVPVQLKQEHEANENPKIPNNHKDSPDPVIQKGSLLRFFAPNIPG